MSVAEFADFLIQFFCTALICLQISKQILKHPLRFLQFTGTKGIYFTNLILHLGKCLCNRVDFITQDR